MSKLHITLVGAQVIPIYLGIKETNPDKVLLVHSNKTIDEAIRLRDLSNIETELIQLDPVDYLKIREKAKDCLSLANGFDEVSVNISGGTKIWSICFYDFFRDQPNTQVFYIDQNSKLYDLKNNVVSDLTKVIDTQMFFKLSGNPLTSFKMLSDYTQKDIECIQPIRKLREKNHLELFYLIRLMSEHTNERKVVTDKGSILEWLGGEGDEKSFSIKLKTSLGTHKEMLSSRNIYQLFLFTGWFELETALIFSKWKYTKELYINSVVSYESTNHSKNEIDLIVNMGQKLLFIECKTSVSDIKDVDKFRNVVRNYGGLGCISILITDEILKENVREKCSDNNILTFSFKQCPAMMDSKLMLLHMLETEIFNINPK